MDGNFTEKILSENPQLQSLPQTLAEVLRVVRDESSSANDLAAVLLKDPALSARVLRVVNSPSYGLEREVGSVTQAVMTVGTRQVTALAMVTSIYGMTADWQGGLDRLRFWRHSLEVAIAARSIAEKIGYQKTEEIFVAGLLHNIGLLVLESSFPEQFQSVWKATGTDTSVIDAEEEVWGTNHARVGQFVLEQWHLPEMLCQAVGRHHHVFTPGSDDAELIPAQIVSLADRISKFPVSQNAATEDRIDRETREIIRQNLNLSTEQLLAVEKSLFSQVVEEAKYLEMDIGSTDELLTEANRMLFDQYLSLENMLEDNRRMNRQVAGEQVRRGYLESLKSTTVSFTNYVDTTSVSMMTQVEEVSRALKSGIIIDPEGLVARTVENISQSLKAAIAITGAMRGLTEKEAALHFDQESATALESRIKKELASLPEEALAP